MTAYIHLNTLGVALSKFVTGAEGNISCIVQDGFIIKSSGTSLKDGSFVACAFSGEPLHPDPSNKPSMEVGFHAVIYQASNFRFIAHTHPINILKILCSSRICEFADSRLFPDHVVFNGIGSCVIPYVTPGQDLALAIRSKIEQLGRCPDIFLLENHGLICCGNSVDEVIIKTEMCEKAAEVFIGAYLLGGPNVLSHQSVDAIQNHEGEIYRKNL